MVDHSQNRTAESIDIGLIRFLEFFLAHTYAVRALGFILIAVGLNPEQTAQLTGVSAGKIRVTASIS